MKQINTILNGDSLEQLKTLPDQSVNCCVTSPPYWGLRDYGVDGQVGLEETPEDFINNLVLIFREVKRVLRDDGTLWLNIGDSYATSSPGSGGGHAKEKRTGNMPNRKRSLFDGSNLKFNCKQKDLVGIPWMLAFALRSDGWYLRQDIIWSKPNPMPESVKDRCTKSHEYIFLLSKSKKYFYDSESIKTESISKDSSNRDRDNTKLNNTPGRSKMKGLKTNHYEKSNKRSVWNVATKPYKDAHFATYPETLIVDCIKAGCPEDGIVLDPFMGAGTTAVVAKKLHRNYIGTELNEEYIKIAEQRLLNELGMFK